jgi:hypothetical protein
MKLTIEVGFKFVIGNKKFNVVSINKKEKSFVLDNGKVCYLHETKLMVSINKFSEYYYSSLVNKYKNLPTPT